jgi:hypothetical protein
MTTYVVLVVDDDEDRWETLTDEQRQERWDGDYAFGKLLEERGGRMTGGAGLTHSRRTRTPSPPSRSAASSSSSATRWRTSPRRPGRWPPPTTTSRSGR